FFVRSYGLGTGELGTWFAIVYGVGGLVGLYWGGVFASRFSANNERLQLKAMAIVIACFSGISTIVYLSPNRYLAFGIMGLAAAAVSTTTAPLFAAIQSLVPRRMTAISLAITLVFS